MAQGNENPDGPALSLRAPADRVLVPSFKGFTALTSPQRQLGG